MTQIHDDPHTFTEDMLEGFLDVHRDLVVGVPGGVVRASQTRPGKVAVVVGGGSGHYPAFCGLVGPGFADGAVVGNLFTSPSAADAYSVGRAAASDAGLLFSTGNYAGDVMNFTLAQERLLAEGIDTRVVFVTDDVASAPTNQANKRRGIAGDFVVFKVAAAAAEQGADLDDVERLARLANDRTRTLGVAFAGCTMPGADHPLFTVPNGMMGVGLGIHGEPGIEDAPTPRAADLAVRLVNGVLAERPADSTTKVGAILNGLGTTKYEELFVLWRHVARLLREAGLEVVEPEVGELVTSLDMAGCSLTLVYLDRELEPLWRASAHTPAYRKGQAPQPSGAPRGASQGRTATVVETGSADSQACARTVLCALDAMAVAMTAAEAELGRIDAVAGDGDHGRGMLKGAEAARSAARTAVDAGAGAGGTLVAAGDAFSARAGGTSGVLWGAMLSAIGLQWGDDTAPSPQEVVDGLAVGAETLQQLGGAVLGDKTMVDALVPFVDTLRSHVDAGAPLPQAWGAAVDAADLAARATANLTPRIGRARPLAARSVGTPDAGAVSLVLVTRAMADALAGAR